MTIKIKYFGLITEITNCNDEILNFSECTISELLDTLYKKYPSLKDKNFQVAQNQELVSLKDDVTGNEIAILPPFAGG